MRAHDCANNRRPKTAYLVKRVIQVSPGDTQMTHYPPAFLIAAVNPNYAVAPEHTPSRSSHTDMR